MYNYQDQKQNLFTEKGQLVYQGIRDNTIKLFKTQKYVDSNDMTRGSMGDSWLALACIDRMKEAGEIREMTDPDKVAGQSRIFMNVKLPA